MNFLHQFWYSLQRLIMSKNVPSNRKIDSLQRHAEIKPVKFLMFNFKVLESCQGFCMVPL